MCEILISHCLSAARQLNSLITRLLHQFLAWKIKLNHIHEKVKQVVKVIWQKAHRRCTLTVQCFCVTLPNFMAIGQIVTEISRFFNFHDGGRPPYWLLKRSIFKRSVGWRGSICVTLPNFLAVGKTATDISRFSGFQDGGRPPSWFCKCSNFWDQVVFTRSLCGTMPNFMAMCQTVAEIWRFIKHVVPWTHPSPPPNGISIGQAVFGDRLYAIGPLSVCPVVTCLWRWCIVAKWLGGSRCHLTRR